MGDTEDAGAAAETTTRNAEGQPPDGRRSRWPRRLLWAVVALPVVVGGLVAGWFAWVMVSFMVSDDPFGTHSTISCSAAMEFAHGRLPERTTDEDCSVDDWMDDVVRGTFRMPREDVDEWLASAYPNARPEEHCDEDICIEFGTSDDPADPFAEPTPSATAATATASATAATATPSATAAVPDASAIGTGTAAPTGADVVRLTVRHENGTTALVTLEAFDD
ncbi:hypothetical protein HW130_22505 [Streptomyces sp. PKU-EA00015]|uniref:hypothetical protein n=1 Tax=Streptomyces sp. PKU-EA00015 TaxID=2748326 RepID=UPI0015A36DA7|nr:hypothetical protein [Streptomyces sp. PKU-EA00015]NWF28995.1 hypothetical protein [Streptomyces sp. PKU-EA00015]